MYKNGDKVIYEDREFEVVGKFENEYIIKRDQEKQVVSETLLTSVDEYNNFLKLFNIAFDKGDMDVKLNENTLSECFITMGEKRRKRRIKRH